MNGKPSSPVLRGLGASNGARLLDPYRITEGLPVIRPVLSAAVLADSPHAYWRSKAPGCQRRQTCVWIVFALLNGILTSLGRGRRNNFGLDGHKGRGKFLGIAKFAR